MHCINCRKQITWNYHTFVFDPLISYEYRTPIFLPCPWRPRTCVFPLLSWSFLDGVAHRLCRETGYNTTINQIAATFTVLPKTCCFNHGRSWMFIVCFVATFFFSKIFVQKKYEAYFWNAYQKKTKASRIFSSLVLWSKRSRMTYHITKDVDRIGDAGLAV